MPMNARLLRPTQNQHPEAADWANRVRTNGGSVSGSTLLAVSRFCRAIDAAGIRDRFYRLNLFCGNSDASLNAVRTPLYRGPSRTETQYGNALDTNVNFVQGDYAETGSSSGLKGNGTSKYLNTGFKANTNAYTDTHFGCGLLATETGSAAYKHLMGAYRSAGTLAWFSIYARKNDAVACCHFGNYSASSGFGDTVNTSSLAIGNIVSVYPTMYRNGVASGATATAGNNYANADDIFVFAVYGNGTAPFEHTDSRLGWYSIGAAMTAGQVASFHTAITSFNSSLSRT